MSSLRKLVFGLMFLALPSLVFAQGSITGVVRDGSGAVLPGVTVTASSPALIERSRTVVSDGSGQYRIIDLRPGAYTVEFVLAGFTTVRREGIELTGSMVVTMSAEMKIGSLTETVTVTGEAALVDVQTAAQQRVLTKDTIESVPVTQNLGPLATLIPGVRLVTGAGGATIQDVGGTAGDAQVTFSVHGSRNSDQVVMSNGVPVEFGVTVLAQSVGGAEEVQFDTSGQDASVSTGGLRINFIPKSGGNTFGGSGQFSGTNKNFQNSNLTDRLKALGTTATSPVKKVVDVGGGFGGPIQRDKLWYYVNMRYNLAQNYVANLYENKNLSDPNIWTYAPDLTRQTYSANMLRSVGGRVTWQASKRNKIAVAYDDRRRCTCPDVRTLSTSHESAQATPYNPSDQYVAEWTAPVTSRLLLEANVLHLSQAWGPLASKAFDPQITRVQVTEQSPTLISGSAVSTFHGRSTSSWNYIPRWRSRFALSYVTGAHSLKMGFSHDWARNYTNPTLIGAPYTITVNRGVPVSLTVTGSPDTPVNGRTKAEDGLYIQDRWTINRLTLNGGLRFDYFNGYAPETHWGPSPMLPNRNLTFPETKLLGTKDLTPRLSAAYDLTGDSKTAIKASLNKYVQAGPVGPGQIFGIPASLIQNTASRSWTDNGNFIPDCDLTNPALQDNRASGGDLCGAFTGNSVLFGKPIPTEAIDPKTQFGWGARGYNWELTTGIQRQLGSRIAVDIGYFRRWYGNQVVTVNRALKPSDFSSFSVTAPVDPRLPDRGGYTVSGFLNVNPDAATRAPDSIRTFAKSLGTPQTEVWNGFDVAVAGRFPRGLMFQGGLSSGRTTTDNCAVSKAFPALNPTTLPFCHVETSWLTDVKGIVSYTIPNIGIQVAGTFQSNPGTEIVGNATFTNADVQASLGRPLSGNAQTISVNIVPPGQSYGDRLNNLDLRVGKILRFGGRRRTGLNFEVYNSLNSDAVLREGTNYSSFRAASSVVGGRLYKFSLQLDF